MQNYPSTNLIELSTIISIFTNADASAAGGGATEKPAVFAEYYFHAWRNL